MVFYLHTIVGTAASEALGVDPDFESGKGWDHFKERVLKANPGEPPAITPGTWRALTLTNSGGYHNFVANFRRQATA